MKGAPHSARGWSGAGSLGYRRSRTSFRVDGVELPYVRTCPCDACALVRDRIEAAPRGTFLTAYDVLTALSSLGWALPPDVDQPFFT